jgi:hypothetical protein
VAIESFATVVPVPDIGEGVAYWRALLGVEPTFVDGNRWAQFDVDGRRIALAGSDRFSDVPSLMLKSSDLQASLDAFTATGHKVSEITEGADERRFSATSPGGWTVAVYAAK